MALFGIKLPQPSSKVAKDLLGEALDRGGKALHLPELGLSEQFGIHNSFAPSHAQPQQQAPVAPVGPDGTPQSAGGSSGGYYSSGGGGASAGGGYAAGPNLTAYRNNIYGDQNQINSLYDQVNGQIGAYGTDRRNQIDANYATQFANNDKAFSGANNGTIGAYQGHGLSDSSLMGNALDQNKAQYQTSNSDLLRSRDQNYADLGSTLNNARQQLGNKPQYDLSQYQDAQSLQDLHTQLGQYIQSLQGSQNNLLTQGQLRGKLDAIAPAQSNLQGQLKSTLDKLVAGNADPASQQAIAQTYISQLPKDQQDQWLQYFTNAQRGLNAPQPAAVV